MGRNEQTIHLDGLEPELSDRCEQEFQRQANITDGELFWYFDDVFEGLDLIMPSVSAQVVLGNFANSGCPVSGLRFGASLYPDVDARWPIHSYQAALFYVLRALEILLNLKHEPRMNAALRQFESSKESQILLHLAEHLISTNALTSSICPEILTYVYQNLYPAMDIGDVEVQ